MCCKPRKILITIENANAEILVVQEFQYKYWEKLKNGLDKCGYKFYYYDEILEEKIKRNGVLVCSKEHEFKAIEKPKDIQKYSFRNWCEVYSENLRLLTVDVPLCTDKSNEERELFLRDGLKNTEIQYLVPTLTLLAD